MAVKEQEYTGIEVDKNYRKRARKICKEAERIFSEDSMAKRAGSLIYPLDTAEDFVNILLSGKGDLSEFNHKRVDDRYNHAILYNPVEKQSIEFFVVTDNPIAIIKNS